MKTKLLISLIVLFFTTGLYISVQAATTITQITANSYEDSFPQIKGNYLVWQGKVDDDWEIFLYNLSTEQTQQITDNNNDDISPQTDGNYVVWTGFGTTGGEIFLYDISSEGTTQITTDSQLDSPPQIANGRVVWTSNQVTTSVLPGEVNLYDIANPPSTTLSTSVDPTGTLDDSSPRINDTTVVWAQTDEGDIDDPDDDTTTLYIYDLAADTTTAATDDFVWTDNPQNDGNLSVLAKLDGSDRDIFIHDSQLGSDEQVTSNDINDRYPRISGDYIAWMGDEGKDKEIYIALYEILDADGDGSPADEDCDDNDPNNFPGNTEVCDGQDNNCDEQADEGLTFDADGDGHSTPDSCAGTKDDCDDADGNNYPGNTEVCDGQDNDCNGLDDVLGFAGSETDNDGDGLSECQGDCNDEDAGINPNADEVCDDGIDNDCDGEEYFTPVITAITATSEPIPVDSPITASAEFTDQNADDTHTATWDWGDETITSQTLPQGDRAVVDNHPYTTPGVYTITLTVSEENCGSGSAQYQYVVVYDPEGGFVTGGGWIMSPEGAYTANPSLTGRANFGFNSKYKKGANVPTGVTLFKFKVADLNFHSNTYEWLVVAGAKAKYKGVGTINGEGEYKFMLSAIDADINENDSFEIDRFRIRIWYEENNIEHVVYDNALGDDSDNAITEISGGSIVIHKAK